MINYKWDVYQFVSGLELRSLFFIILFFFMQLFSVPILPIYKFHFRCGCGCVYGVKFVPIWNDNLCQCSMPYNFSFYLLHYKVSHAKQTTRNQPYCTTNREYHHQLILNLIVHFHTTMKSQKITRKDSNSSNKKATAAAAVLLIIFRLENLQKYIILFSLYPHLCAHYVHNTHIVWKWGHLCWINECDPYVPQP